MATKDDGLLWDKEIDIDELSRRQQEQARLHMEFVRHYFCNPCDDME